MGCDIHIHIEYKKDIFTGYNPGSGEPKYENMWVCGDYFKVNPYYTEGNAAGEQPLELVDFCGDRNYSRFAILADVRNYGGIEYIDEPRGLPDDVTAEVKKDSDYWDCDGHSHSYFTLRELLDFQKDIKPLKHRGMISPAAQMALDESGTIPDEWCQWTNTPGWAIREWETENTVLLPLIDALKKRAAELFVIQGWRWEDEPEKAYEMSNDIRIVFWFDN